MNKISELRKKAGLSQKELGKKVNAAQNTVCNWENGNRTPDYESLKILANIFNCSVEYIMGEKNIDNTFLKTENESLFTTTPIELTEQEKTLLETFRSTTELGRHRIIQSALNIYDEIEKKSTSANTRNSG